jgi:precorrin-6A/cobalt-precorrin-6A reductase
MILLIGGTAETAGFAEGLARSGFRVLVSTATEIPLEIGVHPKIVRRCGRLDQDAMVRLAREKAISVIVDVSHPYADAARHNAHMAASQLQIPYLTWVRPTALDGDASCSFAKDHDQAAPIAFSFARPVLLTTGSRNLAPYVQESRKTCVTLVARVLPVQESIAACRKAGIPEGHVVTGRGPFSVQENLVIIKRFGIGCLVTKDSGSVGGVREKIEAARVAGCKVVVVQRPDQQAGLHFVSLSHLIELISHHCET